MCRKRVLSATCWTFFNAKECLIRHFIFITCYVFMSLPEASCCASLQDTDLRACGNRNTIMMLLSLTWNPHTFSLLVYRLFSNLKVYIVLVSSSWLEVHSVSCTVSRLHGHLQPEEGCFLLTEHWTEKREVWEFTSCFNDNTNRFITARLP